MKFTKKVPVKDLDKVNNAVEIIEKTLREDKANAYTVMGLMVERFGVKEEEIRSKPFSEWPRGRPSLYTKIRLTLEKLVRDGKAKSAKQGRAIVYWWAE